MRETGILLATASNPSLGITQPPLQRATGTLFQKEQRPKRTSSVEVKHVWKFTYTSPYVCMVSFLDKRNQFHLLLFQGKVILL
jgi:hypothetical protein